MSFHILSCRASRLMPDGETIQPWHTTQFGTLVECLDSGSRTPDVATWRGAPVLLIFGGYNMRSEGWSDSAVNASLEISERLSSHGSRARHVAALWPCGGNNLIETIAFAAARRRAKHAAIGYYAPFVHQLLDAGVQVSVMGHSCGGYIAYLLAEEMSRHGKQFHSVILLNAAVRVSEVDPERMNGASRWLCFHSAKDSALRLMQRDFVDEHGGFWQGILAALPGGKKNSRDEPIVGMHGLPQGERVQNFDLTGLIGEAHSEARCLPRRGGEYPSTAERIAMALNEEYR